MKTITADNIEHIQNASNMSIGISGSLAAIGAYTIYNSVELFYQEAKSPYYDYDGILTSLKKTQLQIKVMDPIAIKVTEVSKILFEQKTDNMDDNNSTKPHESPGFSESSESSESYEPSKPSGFYDSSGFSEQHPDLNFPSSPSPSPSQPVDGESQVDQDIKLTQSQKYV